MCTRLEEPIPLIKLTVWFRLHRGTFIPKWITFHKGAMREAFIQIVAKSDNADKDNCVLYTQNLNRGTFPTNLASSAHKGTKKEAFIQTEILS